jgi:acetyl esterase/lipase
MGVVVLGGAALASGKLGVLKEKMFGAVPTGIRAQIDKAESKMTGVTPVPARPPRGGFSLIPLRKELKSPVGEGTRDDTPAPVPPPGELEIVHYAAPLGNNVAYVTPVKAGSRGPAIIWIVGGFGWGVSETAWAKASREDDQSASQFRRAGIATMYPALRGANQNPGHRECFLGEVDDILAAANFLATRADIDPSRIYLGGHSTGGTMVLLAAASTDRFRAIFSFGPVADVRQYGQQGCMGGAVSERETKPRSPAYFLAEIVSPTFIIEGMQSGNGAAFPLFKKYVGQAPVQFVEVSGGTHFTVIAPGCEVIAKAILADTGKTPSLDVTGEAIRKRM